MTNRPDSDHPTGDGDRLDEHYSLASDGEIISRVADAACIPPNPNVEWQAAVVTTVGIDEKGKPIAYVQYLQDAEWRVSERDVLRMVIGMLRKGAGI